MFRTTLAVAVIGLAAVSIAYAALPGRVVASKSATGQFAVTAVNATVKKPKGIWVNLIGKGVDNGLAVIACSRNFTVSSNSKDMNGPGVYRLPILPARADTCHVTASVGGGGRVHGPDSCVPVDARRAARASCRGGRRSRPCCGGYLATAFAAGIMGRPVLVAYPGCG